MEALSTSSAPAGSQEPAGALSPLHHVPAGKEVRIRELCGSPVICAILMPVSSITVVAFACGLTNWLGRRSFARAPKAAHSEEESF